MKEDDNLYESIKAAIRDAAAEVFQRLGFDRTRVRDIAEAVRKAKSSIYYYYTSKETIFLDIIQHETQALLAEISWAVKKESDVFAQIRAYIETRVTRLQEFPNLKRVLADGITKQNVIFDEARKRFFQAAKEILTPVLTDGKRTGVFRLTSVDSATRAILSAIKGLEMSAVLDVEEPDAKANLDHLINMINNGVKG